MNPYLDEVKSEIRRIDHLLYVTLKYTRTVDIIKSIVDRMISLMDHGFIGLLNETKKRRKEFTIPPQPRKRCELLRELYPEDKKLLKFVDTYLFLRDISQTKYERIGDFRKHVAMIIELKPGEVQHINIEQLHEFYQAMKDFLEYLTGKLK